MRYRITFTNGNYTVVTDVDAWKQAHPTAVIKSVTPEPEGW